MFGFFIIVCGVVVWWDVFGVFFIFCFKSVVVYEFDVVWFDGMVVEECVFFVVDVEYWIVFCIIVRVVWFFGVGYMDVVVVCCIEIVIW